MAARQQREERPGGLAGEKMINIGLILISVGSVLIVPAVILFGGAVMRSVPPGEPNRFVGFRTARSMRSQKAWDFANTYCGNLWKRLGWILLILSPAAVLVIAAIVFAAIPNPEDAAASFTWLLLGITAAQVLCMLISIACVEKKLRDTFREDGTKRISEHPKQQA